MDLEENIIINGTIKRHFGKKTSEIQETKHNVLSRPVIMYGSGT